MEAEAHTDQCFILISGSLIVGLLTRKSSAYVAEVNRLTFTKITAYAKSKKNQMNAVRDQF